MPSMYRCGSESAKHSHQTLGDVLDEILAGELGLAELIKSLGISGEAPQCLDA